MIAVIGTGYWGSKIVSTVENMQLPVETYDINDNLEKIKSNNVIIATPANTHKLITKKMLLQKKNVLVEKPAFMSMKECNEIEKIIQSKFMSGHILLYSEHFQYILEHLSFFNHSIQHVECRRLNWGRVQKDISPILHLSPHDIAVLDILMQQIPISVNCKPFYITDSVQPDYVTVDLNYNDIDIQIQTGWYYNEKIRNIKIFTDKGIFDWKDDQNSTTFFANGNDKDNESFSENQSSLQNQIQAFIDYCEKNIEPVSNFAHTKRVTYIVECIEQSLKTNEEIKCSKKY